MSVVTADPVARGARRRAGGDRALEALTGLATVIILAMLALLLLDVLRGGLGVVSWEGP